jgi:uncharacterized iron-regulated protein
MFKVILSSILVLIATSGFSQNKQGYVLYNAKGKKVHYDKMIRQLAEQDIILFGEFHDNPISHWLELEVTKDLFARRPMVMGAEMFEQDNQEALNLYLSSSITAKQLDTMARLWSNYKTDYAPLVEFAKQNKIPFAATNVPRRYASMVAKGNFAALDTISEKEKSWIAPLPIAYDSSLPGYKNMLAMMPGHGGSNLPKAQALKDATMAYFILKHYQQGKVFLHFNGSYHSDNYEGILWHLKQAKPELKYATITTVSQKDVNKLMPEHLKRADFIICVDEDMTSTY